ncbi:response regulator [Glaciecola sp. XM2]|jgi:DNA-binding response OmpR family regulator|uniref:tetratricopeptide repeat-containing response regulator n=1 Tax=Glaciecola sp. XM2 TaxID=1914931 RepID=UPI001BDE0953|nr:tetratricopeptide repeat-containing response regulator [Glaciecola sp. XM2]MBT1451953.1 response regulator [Glaciecola sp. XM2]
MEKLDYSDKRCLVVEDRRPFLMLLRGLLNALGAKTVDTAQSAEAGLKACKQHKYDIVICDLHLGTNRKNGFEFLEEIRKLALIKPSAVFVMISGDSARSMVLGSLEKQPDDYLVKPFSQAQLNARITRATHRRVTLAALYSQIDHQKFELSIETCKHFLETEPRYTNHLLQTIVKLYWKLEKYDAAEKVLQKVLDERALHWAVCSMAKTHLLKGEYDKAIELAKRVIESSKNTVEAYDIIADAYLQKDKKPEALKYILEALNLSPLSIDRHFRVCEIARENGNYELAMNSAKSIYELSQRSVHKNINHVCGFVRSVLDIAANADSKSIKNRYLQETMLTMQRMLNDDSIVENSEDFDFEIFQAIINARMLFIEGKQSESKKSFEETQIKIERNFTEYPVSMAPDSLKMMIDHGDFEEAGKLIDVIKANEDKVDASIAYLIETEMANAKDTRKQYVQHNKKGIALYSEGNYQQAYEEFCTAKNVCPLNINVNLNLMQCLVKLIEKTNRPEGQHIVQARELYRFISNMPLKDTHREKFRSMREDVEKAIS